ncbi:MAG: ABC transporter permease [Balneolaceae bacterium]|nr:ABC transporter permease [Balneolaceae bacterium]
MLANYLKIALRNIKRYTGYTFINIVGLAVGIAICMLIFQYVSHELSYDRYHEKSDRIYRITLDLPQIHLSVTPSMLSPTLQELYPEVETGVRIYDAGSSQPLILRRENRSFEERSFAYADSTLFEVFSFDLLAGNAETALTRPYTVVISRDMARKYFGSVNPLGKALEINGRQYEVTGVMENIPQNSHFRFDFFASLISRSNWSVLQDDVWRAANFYTYIVLEEGVSSNELKEKVDAYIEENVTDNDFVDLLEIKYQPLTDIHLYADTEGDMAAQGDIRYVMAASAIAFLILIIACINYMNLATARSERRSREVGIRKVLGSGRRELIAQFYGEAAFLTILGLAVSILLVEGFLPWFNQLTGKVLTIEYSSLQYWGIMGGIGAVVTLLAGSYPALMLSSFNPSAVLTGAKISVGGRRFRKGLVIFQFAASIFLIIGTLVIYRQVEFIQDKELGYKQENVIVLTAYNEVESRFEAFHSELKRVARIEGAAMASETPTSIRAGYGLKLEGVEVGTNYQVNGLRVSPGLTDILKIDIIAGQPFTRADIERANPEEGEAEYAFLANEALANDFGLQPEELVGRNATLSGREGVIKGVVEDFHFTSLHRAINPLILFPQDGYNRVLVSFESSGVEQSLEQTREVWSRMFPQYPFEYQFLDQEYEALYKQEMRAGNIFTSFAVLAIFIACLGLFGLASYMAERRKREIGVRKVLGATVVNIISLFSMDFIKLIAVSFLLAVPVSWYAMSTWLQNFAYRIEIGVLVIVIAGLLTVMLALLTVGYQSVKAAMQDPVDTIRTE